MIGSRPSVLSRRFEPSNSAFASGFGMRPRHGMNDRAGSPQRLQFLAIRWSNLSSNSRPAIFELLSTEIELTSIFNRPKRTY